MQVAIAGSTCMGVTQLNESLLDIIIRRLRKIYREIICPEHS